ncbi:MAG TPA: hypothetical protein VMT00_10305, partial [Thermoanaerobaculia bacterium]|nr:hypothetical protein [Thermoanaerobaculia bacterium]
DVPLGGQTPGDIVLPLPANTSVVIEDAPLAADGVKVTVAVTGSPAPPASARVALQLVGKKSQIRLAIPGIYIVTDPDTETTVQVTENGPAEVVVILDGSEIVVAIAAGASATIVETIDDNGVLTAVSVTGVTGESGDVTVNGTPLSPGGDPVLLAAFQAKLRVQRSELTLTGTFTPPGSTAIDPGTQDVTLHVGDYTFAAGTLTRAKSGAYSTAGTIAGVAFSIELKQSKGGEWSVKASAKPVSDFTNPVPVSLSIGSVVGSVQVSASLR